MPSLPQADPDNQPGDAVDGFSMARGLLSDVHLQKTDAKAVEAPDEVQKPALSHNAATCM